MVVGTFGGKWFDLGKNIRLFRISLILALLCACSDGPKYQIQTLPDGQQVKVLNISKVRLATPNGVLNFMRLDYQTDLKITDVDSLEKEVDHIWPYFRNDVEKAALSDAVIRANAVPTGTIVRKTKSYGFVYKKAGDGAWSRLGD